MKTYDEIVSLIPEHLLRSKSHMVIITDLEGKYIFVNDVFQKKFAFIGGDFIGALSCDTIHPEDVEKCHTASYTCMTTPNVVVELQVRKPIIASANLESDYYWTNWEFSLFKDDNNQPLGIFCLGTDFTETKRSEIIEKKTQEKLKQSEDKLRAILDSTVDSYILLSPNYTILSLNKVAKSGLEYFFNTKVEEGQNFSLYITKGTEEEFERNFKNALLGQSIRFEKEMIFENGTHFWREFCYFPAYDKQNNLIGINFNIIDIDSRKNAEQKLRNSEYILKAIYNSTTDGTTFIDKDLNIIYNNKTANEICNYLFGIEPKKGDYSLDFMLPHLKDEFFGYYQRVLAGETIKAEKQDNSNGWWSFSLFPVYDKGEELVGIAINVRDIKERKQIALELLNAKNDIEHKNQLLNAILESPKGIIIFSLDKDYNYLSFTQTHHQAMKQIWGVNIKIGENMLQYITSESDKENAKQNFDKALNGEYFIQIEEFGDKMLYRTFWEDRYSPVFNEKHEIIGLTVFVTDITERKQNELKIINQNEKLKVIAWQQSHEVRGPVASILGLLNLIKTEDKETYNPLYLQYLQQSAEQLDKIIHKIVANTTAIE